MPLSNELLFTNLLRRSRTNRADGLPAPGGGTAVRSDFWQHMGLDIHQQLAKMAPAAAPASDVQQMHLWALSPREMTQLEPWLWQNGTPCDTL